MSKIKFLFITDPEIETPLENGEGIMVMDPEGARYVTAWISNAIYQSEIFAPEINWYLKHTEASNEEKRAILKILYEMRAMKHAHENDMDKVLDEEMIEISDTKSFFASTRLSTQKRILLIEEPYIRSLDGCEIPSGYLPFIVDKEALLSKKHLLSLLQESGSSLLMYCPSISEPSWEAVALINEVYTRIYGEEAIYIAHTKEAFDALLLKPKAIASSYDEVVSHGHFTLEIKG